ncbi:hypothetical protein F5878DRAFT_616313 [Lentinula raphanica]|uniref:Uncharacterized protein n=1 Tax=Lentinula raphanica TaxID=153919 RepID=A0AA38UIE3_9AGAR|nr:hypothetical protein F5878DRAFT_616313 [Lentinula raphanica]
MSAELLTLTIFVDVRRAHRFFLRLQRCATIEASHCVCHGIRVCIIKYRTRVPPVKTRLTTVCATTRLRGMSTVVQTHLAGNSNRSTVDSVHRASILYIVLAYSNAIHLNNGQIGMRVTQTRYEPQWLHLYSMKKYISIGGLYRSLLRILLSCVSLWEFGGEC